MSHSVQNRRRRNPGQHGLGVEIRTQGPNFECICERPEYTIHCGGCGSFIPGRISRVCPAHRNHVFLMDVLNCGKCGAGLDKLTEMKIAYDLYVACQQKTEQKLLHK